MESVVARTAAIVGLAVAASFTAGCMDQKKTTTAHVVDQWALRMDTMGLVPVLPPPEDVRVGDIYAYAKDPHDALSSAQRREATRLIASTSRWASLPVLNDLREEYGERRSWPKTPDIFLHTSRAAGQPGWAEPETAESIFATEEAPTRLRIVNLDALTAIQFSLDDLEAVIPTEIGPLVTGEAQPDQINVTFRLGSAEAYSLSLDSIIALLTEPVSAAMPASDDEGPRPLYRLKQPYRDNLRFVANADNRVWLAILSEVIHIRSADITVRPVEGSPEDDEVTAEELAQTAQAVQAVRTDAAGPAPEEGEAETGPVERELATFAAIRLDPIFGAFMRAKAINDVLADSDADDAPGGTMRFLTVTDEAAAIRRVWPRGLAIGVRGLSMEIDAVTGDVLDSQPMMWPAGVTTMGSN